MTVLQTQAKQQLSVAATTMPATAMSSAGTAGSRYIVCITFENAVSAVSVTGTRNGALTKDADSGYLAGDGSNDGAGQILFFSVANGSTLVETISASWTGGSCATMSIIEVSGNPGFTNAGTAKTGSTTLTALSFSITPTNANSFVMGAGLSSLPTGIAVDTGYTFPTNSNGITFPNAINFDNHSHEYIASATGAQALNFHGTGSGGASMYGVAYGVASGGAALAGGATDTVTAAGQLASSFGQILIDDPLHVGGSDQISMGSGPGSGTGDSAEVAFTKLKQWAADINKMTGQLYGTRSILVPTTGFTAAPAAGITYLILNPAGTLATGAVTFPPGPADNQPFQVATTQAITALTANTSDGSTISGAPTGMAASTSFKYRFVAPLAEWIREQ
jgi:hypothetical protein